MRRRGSRTPARRMAGPVRRLVRRGTLSSLRRSFLRAFEDEQQALLAVKGRGPLFLSLLQVGCLPPLGADSQLVPYQLVDANERNALLRVSTFKVRNRDLLRLLGRVEDLRQIWSVPGSFF